MATAGTSSGMRTGSEYLRSLRDGRAIFVDGERVKDVTAASGVPRGGAQRRPPVRHRRGAREPRADDLSLAQDRRAGVAGLADSEEPRRSASEAPRRRGLGGNHLRPDGPHARPRRGIHRGVRGKARLVRGRRRSISPTTCRRSTSICATTISTSLTRSFPRRSTAASRHISRRTRRFMPASSRSATTASSSPAPSSSRPPACSPTACT